MIGVRGSLAECERELTRERTALKAGSVFAFATSDRTDGSYQRKHAAHRSTTVVLVPVIYRRRGPSKDHEPIINFDSHRPTGALDSGSRVARVVPDELAAG